jgi:hypothetical protein
MMGCVGQTIEPVHEAGHDEAEVRVTSDQLDGWTSDAQWVLAPPIEATAGVSRVGVFLGLGAPGEMPRMQARVFAADGVPGEWVDVAQTWGEEDHYVGVADFGHVAASAELRIAMESIEAIEHLRWNAVVPEEHPEADGEVGASTEALRSELSGIGVVARSAWGARATRCTSNNSSKHRMAIHHTVTGSSNPERQLRGIQSYHMDSRGWCDVGYHFLIGSDGRAYEGRPLHLLGSHVGGNNTGNIGISFIGCFHTSGCSGLGPTTPPDGMVEAAGRLAGRLAEIYGIAVNTSTLKGHRDHSGASTSCPGDNVHRRLGDIRRIASSGSPPPPPPPPGDGCNHTYGGTYENGGCSSGYQCCGGRWRTRGACGACSCVETSGRIGCTAAAPAPPPPASCTHTYGGTYADTACSAAYQCCDGRWRTRGSCGGCLCTEPTGSSGCTTGPPPGASCTHSNGGRYANTACSPSWQCCDGRWRSRGSCGACFCTESTGSTGCGA